MARSSNRAAYTKETVNTGPSPRDERFRLEGDFGQFLKALLEMKPERSTKK